MHFNQLLGIRAVEEPEGGVTLECPLRGELMNKAGVAHGGVAASLVDVAAGSAIWSQLNGSRFMTTVELKINYLRPISEGRMVAKARVVKVGKTLCVAGVDLFDGDGNQLAVALVTYMLLGERRPDAPDPGD